MSQSNPPDALENTLLRTVDDVACVLFSSEFDQFAQEMQKCMGMLAKTIEVDRVQIWKNSIREGSLHCSQIAEWDETEESRQASRFPAFISYSRDLPDWEKPLSAGQCIKGAARGMPPAVKKLLDSWGICSFLVIPIMLDEQFWGFAGFDDCRREREFTLMEESILRSGILLIVNALLRNEMTGNLMQAREDALSASRAKSDFLSNMCHDIRTPIDAIIGMTAIGKSGSTIERKDYALEKIENASAYLLGIINDILDMSKIEARHFELAPAEFDFEKMLQEAVELIRCRAEEKHQSFTVTVDKNIPRFLYGDSQRLAQVIANLLSNAVKFTPEEGSIKLDAKLTRKEKDNYTITFEVIDTGIGINMEQQERIFSSFVRAESGTARRHGETGLSLAISKRIIEMMNGRLRVESKPGKGSTFAFTVQVKKGSANGQAAIKEDEAKIHNLFAGRSVLIVEDVDLNREILSALLESTGVNITMAENGKEAIQLYSKDPKQFDLILMDVQMPEMDGYEATRWIRSYEEEQQIITTIPIIALTAKVFREDVEKCLEVGMNDHVGKPIDTEELFEKLGKHLSHFP